MLSIVEKPYWIFINHIEGRRRVAGLESCDHPSLQGSVVDPRVVKKVVGAMEMFDKTVFRGTYGEHLRFNKRKIVTNGNGNTDIRREWFFERHRFPGFLDDPDSIVNVYYLTYVTGYGPLGISGARPAARLECVQTRSGQSHVRFTGGLMNPDCSYDIDLSRTPPPNDPRSSWRSNLMISAYTEDLTINGSLLRLF